MSSVIRLSSTASSAEAREATARLASVNAGSGPMKAETLERLQTVCAQDRTQTLFTHYQTSASHRKRVEAMPAHLKLDRSQWTAHPNWTTRRHLTSFHVQYRCHIQEVLRKLGGLYEARISSREMDYSITDVCKDFETAMSLLQRHVRIEESMIFPDLKAYYRDRVDLQWLFDDHQELLRMEGSTTALFRSTAAAGAASLEQLVELITTVLRLDQDLMNHLGEEEEVVVALHLLSDVKTF